MIYWQVQIEVFKQSQALKRNFPRIHKLHQFNDLLQTSFLFLSIKVWLLKDSANSLRKSGFCPILLFEEDKLDFLLSWSKIRMNRKSENIELLSQLQIMVRVQHYVLHNLKPIQPSIIWRRKLIPKQVGLAINFCMGQLHAFTCW